MISIRERGADVITFGCPTLIELPDIEKTAELCRELGLKFVELNMSFPQYQPDALDVERLIRAAEEYGIFYTVHMDEELNPCCTNSQVAGAYVRSALESVRLAKELKIPTLNLHLLRGVYVTLPERVTYIYAENEALYLARLREFRDAVTEAVGGSGIKIAIENTDGYDLPFLVHGLDLLLESTAFALTFDIGHDHAIGGGDKRIIMERAERLVHMHMHDGAGRRVHLALGDGEMALEEYLALAQSHSCRVVLETKTVDALKKSAAWLRERGYL